MPSHVRCRLFGRLRASWNRSAANDLPFTRADVVLAAKIGVVLHQKPMSSSMGNRGALKRGILIQQAPDTVVPKIAVELPGLAVRIIHHTRLAGHPLWYQVVIADSNEIVVH